MTNQTIAALLKKINKGNYKESVFLRPLTREVDFAYVFTKRRQSLTVYAPYHLYLIKNVQGLYVGAVLDMETDLHWYLSKSSRKQGLMSKALKVVILPHLFKSRKSQQISISQVALSGKDAIASERLAVTCGFSLLKENRDYKPDGSSRVIEKVFQLKKSKVLQPAPTGSNQPLSKERLKDLQQRIAGMALAMQHIDYELRAAYGDKTIEKVVEGLKKSIGKLEDTWWMHHDEKS